MYNISSYLFVALLLCCTASQGQSFRVQGQVLNAQKQPVEFMDVYLTSDTHSSTPHTYTDSLGHFTLEAPRGAYVLALAEFGTQKYSRDMLLTQDMDIGEITVDQTVLLDSITIQAKKKLIERKVDRLVFNVENSVSASGGDGIDVLKIIPGVQLQGDAIKLVGKENIKIMINDKQILLSEHELYNYLKTISFDNISSIELIKNPPASYEAEGDNGVINIKLKKDIEDSWSTTIRSGFQQAVYSTFFEGMGLRYKKKKLSLLIDINYTYGKTFYSNNIQYEYPDVFWNNRIEKIKQNKNIGTLFNLQYDLTDKSNIGFQILSSSFNQESKDFSWSDSVDYVSQQLIKDDKTKGRTKNKVNSVLLNFNYNYKLNNEGKKVYLDIDYLNTKDPVDNYFDAILNNCNDSLKGNLFAINKSQQNVENFSLKMDVDIPYYWATISFGGKISFVKTDNKVESSFLEKRLSPFFTKQEDYFKYSENVQALHFSISKEIGNKLDLKLGLRTENTQNQTNSVTYSQFTKGSFLKFYPTIYVLYTINDKNNIAVNFGKRIQRPVFRDLNPARWYSDSKSYSTGNPFLKPKYVYNYEIAYSYKSLLTFSLSLSDIKDNATQLTYHNLENEAQIFKIENYANVKYIGIDLIGYFKPFSWLESSCNVYTNYMILNPYVDIFKKKYTGWQAFIMTSNTITMNNANTFFSTIYFEYNFPGTMGYGKASEYSTLNVELKYLLLNKKMVLGLQLNDIIKKYFYQSSNTSSNIYQSFKQYYDTQNLKITLTYKFGNKLLNLNKRTNSNQDEFFRSN